MEHREAHNLRRVRGFEFRHQNRPAGIASQVQIILPAPLRRLGTLQLDRINGRKIIAGAGSNVHVPNFGCKVQGARFRVLGIGIETRYL